mgnify:CR=1 FL=1
MGGWRERGPPLSVRTLKPVKLPSGRSTPGVGNVAVPVDGARARARGGPVEACCAYVIGEKGPEIFRPRSSGTIIPNGAAAAARGAGPARLPRPRRASAYGLSFRSAAPTIQRPWRSASRRSSIGSTATRSASCMQTMGWIGVASDNR